MKPQPSRAQCVDLWNQLIDGEWHKAREIPMNSRLIRAICSSKPHIFLSTQKGYKRVKDATTLEIEIAASDLRSRVKHINARAAALDKELANRYNGSLI